MMRKSLSITRGSVLLAFFLILAGSAVSVPAAGARGDALSQENSLSEFAELPAAGKRIKIDESITFVYEFTEKPRLGTAILKIQVFDKEEKTNIFKIIGRTDMPSMAGAHESGDQEFKLNKKDDYLLPITIVMPGEWEVKLTFLKDGELFFRGSFRFDV